MNHQLCPLACDFWQSILRALALGTHCKHLHVFYDCVVMVFLWLIAHSNIVTSTILAVKTCLQYMLSTCAHILCTQAVVVFTANIHSVYCHNRRQDSHKAVAACREPLVSTGQAISPYFCTNGFRECFSHFVWIPFVVESTLLQYTTSYELFVFRHNMGGAGAKIINLPYMEYDVPMLEPFHP